MSMQNLRHTDLPDVRQFEIESKLIQVVEQHLGGEVLALNKPLWVFISDDLKTYRILSIRIHLRSRKETGSLSRASWQIINANF